MTIIEKKIAELVEIKADQSRLSQEIEFLQEDVAANPAIAKSLNAEIAERQKKLIPKEELIDYEARFAGIVNQRNISAASLNIEGTTKLSTAKADIAKSQIVSGSVINGPVGKILIGYQYGGAFLGSGGDSFDNIGIQLGYSFSTVEDGGVSVTTVSLIDEDAPPPPPSMVDFYYLSDSVELVGNPLRSADGQIKPAQISNINVPNGYVYGGQVVQSVRKVSMRTIAFTTQFFALPITHHERVYLRRNGIVTEIGLNSGGYRTEFPIIPRTNQPEGYAARFRLRYDGTSFSHEGSYEIATLKASYSINELVELEVHTIVPNTLPVPINPGQQLLSI